MKKTSLFVSASLTSLVAIGTIAVPAYAWHPKGTIIKTVQNQTAGTAQSDANDAVTAVSAAPGDTLLYTITVNNIGTAAANGNNDMAKTMLTDTLPAGVELVSNPAQRTISENLGTIKPGKSVTKTYAVKVTSSTNGDTITNEACFTGDSLADDNPQHGCNIAIITVKVPPVTPPVVPPKAPELPATLPNTGSTSRTAALAVLGGLIAGSVANHLHLRRRANKA